MSKDLIQQSNIEDLFKRVQLQQEESERLAVEPYSYWKSVWRQFKKKPSALISVGVMILVILLSILVPILSKHNVHQVNYDYFTQKPSSQFWFGTDQSGKDMWTVIWTGARTSLSIAFIVSLINSIVGVIIGTIWGYFRKLDLILLEVYNFVMNIPSVLYYLILMVVFENLGISDFTSLILAMTLTGWITLARFIRDQVLIISNREYNVASRTLATPARRIIIYNLLPYVLTVIITQISLQIPAVIGTETSLSYFGIGLDPTAISLGRTLSIGTSTFTTYPHLLIFPAVIVAIITISFYLIGLGLADALDPKTHR